MPDIEYRVVCGCSGVVGRFDEESMATFISALEDATIEGWKFQGGIVVAYNNDNVPSIYQLLYKSN